MVEKAFKDAFDVGLATAAKALSKLLMPWSLIKKVKV